MKKRVSQFFYSILLGVLRALRGEKIFNIMNWQDNILNSDEQIRDLLKATKRIAVIGIKTEEQSFQPAFYVPQYMKSAGFEIVPVPVYYPDATEILGAKF